MQLAYVLFRRKRNIQKFHIQNNNNEKLETYYASTVVDDNDNKWLKVFPYFNHHQKLISNSFRYSLFSVCLLVITFHWRRHDAFHFYWRNRTVFNSTVFNSFTHPVRLTRTYFSVKWTRVTIIARVLIYCSASSIIIQQQYIVSGIR